MLGHRVWMHANREHEAYATLRGGASQLPNVSEFPRDRIYQSLDCRNIDEVIRVMGEVRPEIVINCIGIIKQSEQAQHPLISIEINALWPHRLAAVCKACGARLIHISTDCVFSGRKGGYIESDTSDAEDLYGRSKFLGEVDYPNAITLRTSIIGRELKTRFGLMEWFMSQKGAIKGFTKALYTGFTTDELSRIILDVVAPRTDLRGLWHVSSEPISKYDLLLIARTALGMDLEIVPDSEFVCDRSLDSGRFRLATGYRPPSWEEMISEMSANDDFYKKIG